MIARVRIAPVEQWCEPIRKAVEKFAPTAVQSVGLKVEIDTATMHSSPHCGGKAWIGKAPTGWSAFSAETGESTGRTMKICEHCLEMD